MADAKEKEDEEEKQQDGHWHANQERQVLGRACKGEESVGAAALPEGPSQKAQLL